MKKKKINNIFLSKDALTNKDKLLILVQGSGPVRAGMWARSLCFNDTLHTGACIDYIKQAQKEGYGIIVLNPNLNGIRKEEEAPKVKYNFFDPRKPKKLEKNELNLIEGSESPPKHVITSYLKYISQSKAEHIVFVAHSAGGWATCELLKSKYGKSLIAKTRGIGFTDSVHTIEEDDPKYFLDYLMQNTINWVTSKKKLDTFIKISENQGCTCLSAGHEVHE